LVEGGRFGLGRVVVVVAFGTGTRTFQAGDAGWDNLDDFCVFIYPRQRTHPFPVFWFFFPRYVWWDGMGLDPWASFSGKITRDEFEEELCFTSV
jgi:hypothetical protein